MKPSTPAVAAALLLACLPALAAAQAPTSQDTKAPPAPAVADVGAPLMDIFDLIRVWRHPETAGQPAAAWDSTKPMIAAAPVIGAKPTSGVMLGVAGNVAFFRGDPATTHISSAVVSATYSTKHQTALTGRFTAFARDDAWRIEGDNRAQWTSQDAYGLGTATTPDARLNARYNFFRVYETPYYRLAPGLFGGVGFHLNVHSDVRAGTGTTDEDWQESDYVRYTTEHGLPLSGQTSAGASLNLLFDRRDSQINPSQGAYANASYRAFFKGLLGGDSNWQELYLDARKYVGLAPHGRKMLAFWGFADVVTGGVAPYMDLPATGMDTYGRTGRGYGEGRFRGERLLYGEMEYRASLMRNGLVGWVAFVNVTTVTNLETGERLFDSLAPGAGAGLRLLINKRSRTNLCFDVGFGKDGSRGIYLAVQEAF